MFGTPLRLPKGLKKRIASLAKGMSKTSHDWMIVAIEARVIAVEKRREFVESALASEREVEKTGLVYRSEDVHAWFIARTSGKKATKPQPYKRKPRA
jgi:predicted transcriptional regulator